MSIDSDDYDFELTPEEIAELDRRVAAYKKDPSLAIPWEQVKTGSLMQRR